MKKLLAILALSLACILPASDAPVVTQGPVLPWRIQVDLAFTDEGDVTSASPQVFYNQKITVDDTTLVKDHGLVTWDSVAKAAEPVNIILADGTTATTTRGAVLLAVLVIGAQEKAIRDAVE